MVDGLRLYFLRHGRADRSQYHGDDDDLRPLTDEGRRRLRVSADFIAGLEPGIDLIVTSPLARAAQRGSDPTSYFGHPYANRPRTMTMSPRSRPMTPPWRQRWSLRVHPRSIRRRRCGLNISVMPRIAMT